LWKKKEERYKKIIIGSPGRKKKSNGAEQKRT
jgi:hypothetical protein